MNSAILNLSRILRETFTPILLIAIIARLASPVTANASYLLLAGYALRGRTQTIKALVLSWLFTMISSGIAPPASFGAVGRYLVMGSAFLSVFNLGIFVSEKREANLQVITRYTLFVGTFLIGHSLFFSLMPDVSIIRSISWVTVVVTIIEAWSNLSPTEYIDLQKWLYIVLLILVLTSLPLFFLPIGYLVNGTGFQGILNQPQAFGIMTSMFSVWTIGQLLTNRPAPIPVFILTGLSLTLTILSESRGALFSTIISIILGLSLIKFFSNCSIIKLVPGLSDIRFQLFVIFCLVLMLIFQLELGSFAEHFISKSGESRASNVYEAYNLSRGEKKDVLLENIKQHPFAGIGFGVPSELSEKMVAREPLFNLPVSVSAEKSILPLAIWEELGPNGFILFLVWFLFLLRRSALQGFISFIMALAILLINMTECIFFSPGGMGLLSLVLLGWAVSKPVNRSLNPITTYG